MKVLFFYPSRAGQGNVPLNIPLLISVLKNQGHDVRLFDLSDYATFDYLQKSYESIFFKKAELCDEKILAERKEFYKNKSQFIFNAQDLKTTDYHEDFEKTLNDYKPDLIAVSCLSVDYKFVCDFLLPFKKKHKIPVIFGGIHSILLPEETLMSEACDFVCIGEGEVALPNFLSAFQNRKLEQAKGVWYKKDKGIIKNPPEMLTDLTTISYPDYECFDPVHFYRPFDGKIYKMLNYELSRGCLFNCTYCVNGVLRKKYRDLGKYHRIKGVEQSIEELEFLIGKYNFNFIRFWDEDFTSVDSEYLEQYAQRYIEKIRLPFLIYARVSTVSVKKIELLKNMGCKTFAMGIESGNEFIRNKIMNRKMSNKTIIDKFNLVKSYGIRVSAYNIIGLPKEKREYIFDTIELNRTINPDSFSVTMLEPYKGTPIRTMCEAEGLDPSHEVLYNQPQFVPKGMTRDELYGLFRTFPFYVRFDKSRYDEIRLGEEDDGIYNKLLIEFNNIK